MSLSEITGQAKATFALRRALKSGRVAHAYLFCGHQGVGKLDTAREFAKALVCSEGGDDACGKCPNCTKAEHGAHPDIHMISPEGAGRLIKLEVIQEQVRDELQLKPHEAARKVVVIEDAHAMNKEAQNSLLKTLEEPPPATVIILVTPRPDGLYETINSRCQTVRFSPLEPEHIEAELRKRGQGTELSYFLARSCGGSLARAVEMIDKPALPQIRKNLFALLAALCDNNITDSAAQISVMVKELAATKPEERSMTEWLFDAAELFYRDVALRQTGADDKMLANIDSISLIEAEAAINSRGIDSIIDTLEQAKRYIRSNVDPEMTVLDTLSRIAMYRTLRAA